MNGEEKSLIIKAKRGDIEAFEQLIEIYQKKVFNIALRMIGNYEDANDMAQEVFIRVFRSLKDFKEQSTFSTWIYRITTNVCLDEIRKRKNKKVVYIDEDVKNDDGEIKRQVESDDPTPELVAEKNYVKQVVNEAINMLSEEHRTVIVLRDIQGFSYEEIAKITKCPEGTVKSRINRARHALKDILSTKKELFNEDYVK